MDTALIATGAILVIGAGVVFALSVWVGMLLGRRMDGALVARQAAEGPPASDQATNVGEEDRVDE